MKDVSVGVPSAKVRTKMGNRYVRSVVLLLLLGLRAFDAGADTVSEKRMYDSVAVYAGQGADHNLQELPGRIVKANLDWEKSYFNAVGLTRANGTLGQGWQVFEGTPLAAIRQGYELVLVQHRGLQDNAEVGAAYTLKTPDLELGALGVNFGSGIGFSYALGNPTYEDGAKDDPGRRYRLQLLLLFDLEWRVSGLAHWSLVTRVHHRSGVYGLIAPPHVGSNFLAAGIRYSF
ncbi:MAG: hypothetical protein KJ795_01320 [Gammaproteobacteria bacterium]|nr:hypothetical protein [Gammaproteobacteria bacterium]MBU1775684.1 hypothetical protein [Gammaproteobacteria bacterium]